MLDTQPYATLLLEGRKAKALQTERRTDGRTDGRTLAHIESLCCDLERYGRNKESKKENLTKNLVIKNLIKKEVMEALICHYEFQMMSPKFFFLPGPDAFFGCTVGSILIRLLVCRLQEILYVYLCIPWFRYRFNRSARTYIHVGRFGRRSVGFSTTSNDSVVVTTLFPIALKILEMLSSRARENSAFPESRLCHTF